MGQKKRKEAEWAIAILIPLIVGGISAFLTRSAMQEYEKLPKPAVSPPAWIFPVVWTILYILMGIASYLIYQQINTNKNVRQALRLYGLQLFFNFGWSILFFNLEAYFIAFLWLLALWVLIWFTLLAFYSINKKAAWLLVPYLVWVTFAGYLNFAVLRSFQ